MLTILKLRSARKKAKETLRHARHLVNMRGDIMPDADVAVLRAAIESTLAVAKSRDTDEIERLFIKTGNRIDVVAVSDIIHIEAEDDYVEIFTADKKYLKKETMNYLEKSLSKETFVRVHRSSIINTNYIQKLERYGKESYVVILNDGSKVNVSKSRVKELKEQLGF